MWNLVLVTAETPLRYRDLVLLSEIPARDDRDRKKEWWSKMDLTEKPVEETMSTLILFVGGHAQYYDIAVQQK